MLTSGSYLVRTSLVTCWNVYDFIPFDAYDAILVGLLSTLILAVEGSHTVTVSNYSSQNDDLLIFGLIMPFPGQWSFDVLLGQQMSSYLPSCKHFRQRELPFIWLSDPYTLKGNLPSSSHILIWFILYWLLKGKPCNISHISRRLGLGCSWVFQQDNETKHTSEVVK